MEEKFYNTKKKNFTQKAAASWSGEERGSNIDLDQDNSEQQLQQAEVLDDLAVVPSNLQAISQDQVEPIVLTEDEQRRILLNLAGEYHKLVRDVEWHLPKDELSSGIRLAAAASQSQSLSRYLGGQEVDLEAARVRSIGFVDLFRQRMYFERLGIPLTTLELLYMGDSEREWRRSRIRDQVQDQVQDQDQDNEYSMDEYVKSQDNCTQTDHDDEGSDGRLHGGYRLSITQVPKLPSKQSCECDHCVKRKKEQESFHPTYNSNKPTKYTSNDRRSEPRSSDWNYNASSELSCNFNEHIFTPASRAQSRNRNQNRSHDKSDVYNRHILRYEAEERNNRMLMEETAPPQAPPSPPIPPSRKYSPPPPSRKHEALQPPPPLPHSHSSSPVSSSVTNLKDYKDHKNRKDRMDRSDRKDNTDRNKLYSQEYLLHLHNQGSNGCNHRHVSDFKSLVSVSGEIKNFTVRRKPKIINIPDKVAAQLRDCGHRPEMGDGVELMKTPRPSRRRVQVDQEVSVLMVAKPIKHTEVISSVSQADSCSETEKTVSTGSFLSDRTGESADFLSDIWYNPGPFEKVTNEDAAKRANVLEYNPINMLHSGYKGAPILDEDAAQLARDRADYFARRFDKLTVDERGREIVLRLNQLRLFQDQVSDTFYQKLKSRSEQGQRPAKPSATKINSVLHCCPMLATGCSRLISEAILAHFLEVHFDEPGMVLSEVDEHDKMLIKFKPATFKRSSNVCLSMIVHTGFKDLLLAPSVLYDIPFYNACLPLEFSRYTEHLPIFVMACRTRLRVKKADDDRRKRRPSDQSKADQAHLTADSLFETSSETTIESAEILGRPSLQECPGDEIGENVMALWMVSVELPEPIYVDMAVFNQRMDVCRTSIMQVRSFSSNQNIEKFLSKSKNYMRLTGHDMRVLTNNYTEAIYLEISIRQYKLP